eukprot:sb/3464303/
MLGELLFNQYKQINASHHIENLKNLLVKHKDCFYPVSSILIQQEFSQHNKRISVMGGSILSGKNSKCSESSSLLATKNLSNSDPVHSHFNSRGLYKKSKATCRRSLPPPPFSETEKPNNPRTGWGQVLASPGFDHLIEPNLTRPMTTSYDESIVEPAPEEPAPEEPAPEEPVPVDPVLTFCKGRNGGKQALYNGFIYSFNRKNDKNGNMYWCCKDNRKHMPCCNGRLITNEDTVISVKGTHCHLPSAEKAAAQQILSEIRNVDYKDHSKPASKVRRMLHEVPDSVVLELPKPKQLRKQVTNQRRLARKVAATRVTSAKDITVQLPLLEDAAPDALSLLGDITTSKNKRVIGLSTQSNIETGCSHPEMWKLVEILTLYNQDAETAILHMLTGQEVKTTRSKKTIELNMRISKASRTPIYRTKPLAPSIPVNRGPTVLQEPTETNKQPIRTHYLGHMIGYQPIRDQYLLIRGMERENI